MPPPQRDATWARGTASELLRLRHRLEEGGRNIAEAAHTLGAAHLEAARWRDLARVETLAGPFDVVSCRAFAALADFTAWSRQALAPHGVWLAMKGKHPHDEIAALPADVSVFHVEQLTVPGLQAERCILWLRPVA